MNFSKLSLTFIRTFMVTFLVLCVGKAAFVAYRLSISDSPCIKTFYIVNASDEIFNVKITANKSLILDKSLESSSNYRFEWELENAITYEIQYKIGDAPQESVYKYDFSHGANYYYIIASSKNEFVFESISLKEYDF